MTSDEFVSKYLSMERCRKACEACGNHGRLWSCPPFAPEPLESLSRYGKVTVYGARIVPAEKGRPLSDCGGYFTPVRRVMEKRLLELEKTTGGRAAAFAGRCLYCPEGECSRITGGECRHPELVRPSLEACGFDVVAAAEGVLGMKLLWSADGLIPEYLTLVAALFHD